MEIIRLQTEIAEQRLDLSGVLNVVVDRIPSITNAEGAIVECVEGTEMLYRSASGFALPLLGTRAKQTASLSGLCVAQGQILRSDDTLIDPRVYRGPCENIGVRSIIVAPLRYDGSVVGVLKIVSSATHAFTARDVRILELMSELIVTAMSRADRDETNGPEQPAAAHDPLTGLANRTLFFDVLCQYVSPGRRQLDPIAILLIGLDGLQRINEDYGHRAGDAAIREMALRISRIPRKSDLVGHLGGDMFGVILIELSRLEDLLSIVNRISRETDQFFRYEGKVLHLTASIGYARFPVDGTDLDSLLETAEQSMNQIKQIRSPRPAERETRR
jgi:diguanylate cyclase (GGDEF)-like protein